METSIAVAGADNSGERRVLVFRLGAREYGIDIDDVQEIQGWDQPATIANAPPSIVGVIELRNKVVPLVDLRLKLGLGEPRYDDSTTVIVVNVAGCMVGAVVDSVSELAALATDGIKPPPQAAAEISGRYILGSGSLGGRTFALLDIQKLMSSSDVERPHEFH